MPIRSAIVASLLIGAVAAPAAHAAQDGAYRGRTPSAGAVSAKVARGRLVRFSAVVYASCGLQSFNITVAYPPAGRRGASAQIRRERFTLVFKGSPDIADEDDRRTVTGTFRGARLTGHVSVEGLCSADTDFSLRRTG